MNIRTRLALQFLLLASFILGISFIVIYQRAEDFREEEFRGRLHDRGANAAKLLIQVDEVDDLLLRKLEQMSLVRLPEEAISIYDQHDALRFHHGTQHRPSPIGAGLLDSIRAEASVKIDMDQRELYGFVFKDERDRFVVISSGRDLYGRSKLHNQAQVMVVTFLIGLVLIFLVGRFFAMRALSPLQRLVGDLHEIGASDLSKRIKMGSEEDELAQLAASFNDLLARLQDAFLVQKNFISNASHEMRTPLTAISGQLEVLLIKDRSGEEYRKAIRSVVEDMHSLNRLSDRLLLMAHAETGAAAKTFLPVRMDELIWVARSEVLRSTGMATVNVVIDEFEDESDLVVSGNEALLRSMITNLIENACKYASDHIATVRLTSREGVLSLAVEDQGPGIAPEDHELIFEHFYRALNTGGAKGHGIGLSLVKRIVELHGGSIIVRSALGAGACFTVRLPKAH